MSAHQFEYRLGADPLAVELESEAARLVQTGELPNATQLLERARLLDSSIRNALRIDTPDLTAQLLAISADRPFHAGLSRRRWLALAAGASAIAVTAGSFWRSQNSVNSFAQACADHMSHEPFALARMETVPATLSKQLFERFGFRLVAPLDVNYVQPCVIQSQFGLHLVVQQQHGPVTVLLFTERQSEALSDTRMGASLVRVRDIADGTIVLLAESSQDFDGVESAFLQSLRAANA